MTSRYVTTRDIIIPAGTELTPPPTESTRWRKDYEAIVADGRDNVVYLSADVKEALATGLIRELS
jgi:hypothetical protein